MYFELLEYMSFESESINDNLSTGAVEAAASPEKESAVNISGQISTI